jgi:hypothetical protein
MNFLFIINHIFDLYNYITLTSTKAWETYLAVYRVCTTNPVWYILENGQFTNSSDMNIFNKEICWSYDGSIISRNNSSNSKKLPFLSFEFTYENVIINMDDFIENTKYKGNDIPPLAVIMAAFCINKKVLYPWINGKFTVFSKMGDQIEFLGIAEKFPDT